MREEMIQAATVMAQVPDAAYFTVRQELRWWGEAGAFEGEPSVEYWASFQIKREIYGKFADSPLKAAVLAVAEWAAKTNAGKPKLEAVAS